MKIIKEFRDDEFFTKIYDTYDDPKTHTWSWGLNDNGKLCYRTDEDRWWQLLGVPNKGMIAINIDILTMQKIVKEFAHLLPLI